MSVVALDQPSSGKFIFGDQQLHFRLFAAIELLAQIVISTPRPVSAPALSKALGKPVREVRALLHILCKSGLVCPDEMAKDAWYCAGTLDTITLADIFCCVSSTSVESAALRKRKSDITLAVPSRTTTQQSVDLVLMQATIAVNQVVLQHLQQFDLGRLRVVASAAPFRALNARLCAYSPEPC